MDSATAAQWALLASSLCASLPNIHSSLAQYAFCWAVFHISEYTLTKWRLPGTLTPHSFLLYGARGSLHLMGVHLLSVAEHVVWKRSGHGLGLHIGVLVSLAGIVVRATAMYQCGESFSHYIETSQRGQVLVTAGIYKWCRHPSYLGFLVYVVGMQVILGTVVLHALCLIVLGRFFFRRIRFEEWFLVNRLYGEQYVQYQRNTACLVPFLY